MLDQALIFTILPKTVKKFWGFSDGANQQVTALKAVSLQPTNS